MHISTYIDPELLRRARIKAAQQTISFVAFLERAIQAAVKKSAKEPSA